MNAYVPKPTDMDFLRKTIEKSGTPKNLALAAQGAGSEARGYPALSFAIKAGKESCL